MNAVLRGVAAFCLMAFGGLVLSGCWSWVPQDSAGDGPPPSKSSPEGRAAESKQARTTEWYTVVAGDTLFSIAWRHRVQVSVLAAWNNLGDGSLILVGQRIRLTPPPGNMASDAGAAATVASPAPAAATGGGSQSKSPASPVGVGAGSASSEGAVARSSATSTRSGSAAGANSWRWPTGGRLDVDGARARPGDYGIRILGTRGQVILAADGGKVMYAGDALKAYGLLVIVQHTPQWLSAYGHNETILVKEGDEVRAGQPIATMGSGPGNAAMLHFEIRRNGKPVEPIELLPSRN